MPKELVLIRHAHAEPPGPGQSDLERALSAIGHEEATKAGVWLKAHAQPPDRVLCSPAKRTRETLDDIMLATGPLPVQEEAAIYEAGVGTLIGLIEGARDAHALWLVGHNPALEQLSAFLSEGRSGEARGLPPGGTVILRLPDDVAIEPGVAEVLAFWWP
ncbi:SixA phosphatase family protein [Solilutibacter silvestris]|uniref:Phosphohistidine phosphatase SixA n=1 Tax=Solilutibacter silvestris TaxID=1645665 RepID=A0A2K1Q193_9GAMM|nr:histidine phosphatase family protein [Lysobacter silvestris]PNS08818.1 Phosphohistidine phosphatase SixA [Lysobacter silvestris]